MAKTITIKLDENFGKGLRHFKKKDPRHISLVGQVKMALLTYWAAQHGPDGIDSYNLALNADDWDPKDMFDKAEHMFEGEHE